MSQVIQLLFHNRDETLRIIDTRGAFIRYASNVDNPICPLINTEIKFVKTLGKGLGGAAFEIEFPGHGTRQYTAVAKRVDLDDEVKYVENTDRSTVADFVRKDERFPVDAFVKINGGNPNQIPDRFILPMYLLDCTIEAVREYKNLQTGDIIIVRPGYGIVCSTNSFSEYAIALIVSEYYEKEQTFNFIDTFAFAICGDGIPKQYTFMERIDLSLSSGVEGLACQRYPHLG